MDSCICSEGIRFLESAAGALRRETRLIDKGLLYTTSHGHGDFTVPQFDRYMRRNHDLAPPRRR